MISERTLNMIRVIKDKKGRYIFYDKKKKVGYVIPEKKVTSFFLLSYRHVFLVVIAFFLYTFNVQYILLVALAIAYILLTELYFKKKLMSQFKKIENIDMNLSASYGKPTKNIVIVKSFLYVILAGLLVALAIDKYTGQMIQPLFFIGAAASLYFGYMSYRSSQS
jgi:hypothetical protein